MTERVTNPQRSAPPKRPSNTSTQAERSKAEKRALAREARAKAVAAQKRNRMLSIVGAAAAVLVLIVGLTLWIRSGDSSTPAGSTNSTASGAASAAATPSTPDAVTSDPAAAPPVAFPPVPAGADPALSTKPVVKAGTGTVTKLVSTTLVEGKGAATKSGQNLTVNYVGVTYVDGKEFDSSWKKSQAFDFQVGTGGVIKGWDQGLVGVKVGSRVQLDIPASLAYGDSPGNGAPAGTLRFVVDVLAAA